ncbi:ArsR/SmtB family transcription factor [Dyella flagellata]|uniref:Transcriptional regulator n=1 Tax=Dyella flagellata TaxID=1867833 RepID=A0ABQ5XF28_9GAMM|nr:metalloregulator ArsR/SmtB family transcription factor [Dyella flagellata]GLQ89188.1 transcriptional regulator [Dyella flagellata]
MVKYSSTALDNVFLALADPTRRAMLGNLAKQSLSVGELAAPYEMSLAAASKHIKLLERAGLIERTVQGRTHLCRLNAMPMHAGMEWIRHYEQFWTARLDALAALLCAEDEAAAKAARKKPRRKGQ